MHQTTHSTAAGGHWRSRIWNRTVQEKASGTIITGLLVGGLYALASLTDVSTARYVTRVIDFTAVSAPSVLSATTESAPVDEPVVETPVAPAPPLRQTINLQAAQFEFPAQLDAQVPERARMSAELQSIERETPVLDLNERTPLQRPSARDLLPGIRREATRRATTPERRVVIGVPERLELPDLDQPLERAETRDLESRTQTELELEPQDRPVVSFPLADWIRARQREVPAVVLRHMEFRESDAITSLPIEYQGVTYEAFLMTRGAVKQVHVLLVDGTTAYYFVDGGFQGRASRFRLGTVTRTAGVISRIVSQEHSTTSAEAELYRRVFIAWWNSGP